MAKIKEKSIEPINKVPLRDILIYFVMFLIILIIDQFTKNYFFRTQNAYDFGWVAFNLVKNTGASFGILKQYGLIIMLISFVVLAGIIYFFNKVSKKARYFLALIATGLVGNLINRAMYGYVIDFIDFKFWPVFNVADSSIFIGVFGLIIIFLIEYAKENKKSSV